MRSPAPRRRYDAGARWVVLCDTNGGTLPEEVEAIVREVAEAIPGDHLGIHAHNDTEQAVANSLAAVRAGARQIQGTLNGIGERCGNANLTSLIPTLMLKPVYAERFETGVRGGGARRADRAVAPLRRDGQPGARTARRPMSAPAPSPPRPASTPRRSSRDPRTYEHVPPETVGNRRHVLVSDQAGKANLLVRARPPRRGGRTRRPPPRRAAPRGQGARSDRLCLRGRRAPPSSCSRGGCSAPCRITSTSRAFTSPSSAATTPSANMVSVSEAVVKVLVGGERLLTVGEGNGPVNALDHALRKDLGVYREAIADLEADRLQGPHPQRRHRGGDPRADRERRRLRRLPGSRSACRRTSSTPRSRR